MTTTLRPTGPQTQQPGGPRVQTFQIRDNGSPVGQLVIAARSGDAQPEGWIEELTVEPAARRRGRGSLAALAAEEILRDWGCPQVLVKISQEQSAALRTARALGYRDLSHTMVKTVSGEQPPTVPAVRVREMTPEEYPEWLVRQRAGYAKTWSAQGLTPGQAADRANRGHAELLPQGQHTPNTALRVVERHGAPAGSLWVRTGGGFPEGADAYVFDIEVSPDHRQAGLGRVLMREAEQLCHGAGGTVLGLHVFADNAPALALYTSLGYRHRQLNLLKSLG